MNRYNFTSLQRALTLALIATATHSNGFCATTIKPGATEAARVILAPRDESNFVTFTTKCIPPRATKMLPSPRVEHVNVVVDANGQAAIGGQVANIDNPRQHRYLWAVARFIQADKWLNRQQAELFMDNQKIASGIPLSCEDSWLLDSATISSGHALASNLMHNSSDLENGTIEPTADVKATVSVHHDAVEGFVNCAVEKLMKQRQTYADAYRVAQKLGIAKYMQKPDEDSEKSYGWSEVCACLDFSTLQPQQASKDFVTAGEHLKRRVPEILDGAAAKTLGQARWQAAKNKSQAIWTDLHDPNLSTSAKLKNALNHISSSTEGAPREAGSLAQVAATHPNA